MKTKELIKQLQECDPSGEIEVCVSNVDIHYVTTEPAYYDGKLQLLVRDPALTDCYDVIGGKYMTTGSKVVITLMSITDVLWDDPDATIDYSDIPEHSRARYEESDNKTRQASRDVTLKVSMEAFARWVKKKADELRPDNSDRCKSAANYFYEKNLHPDDPIKDIPPKQEKLGGQMCTVYPSIREREEAMWDDTLEVYWCGGWGIRKKDGSSDSGEYLD